MTFIEQRQSRLRYSIRSVHVGRSLKIHILYSVFCVHFSPCQSAHDDQDELLAKSNILLASIHFPERYPHGNDGIDWDCQTSENFLAWIWLDSSDFQKGVLYFTLLEYIQV